MGDFIYRKTNQPVFLFVCLSHTTRIKARKNQNNNFRKAFELFYEEGFKSSSIDRIVKASNLTKGAFYHHFKSKKELGLKVIELKI
ncbi:TetR/AcrR family transcriptional regulator [Cyclobacterium sediminis]